MAWSSSPILHSLTFILLSSMLSPQPVTSHHFFALCKPMLLRKSSRIQRRQHQQKEGHGSVHVDVTSKLPDVSPYLVLPPTPSSPDDLLAGQTLVDWRVQDENVNTKKNLARHEKVPTYRPKSRLGLGLTGLTSKADKLPPSPVSVTLSDHQDARDEPPQAAQQISFDRIIASGHPLHPFLLNNYSILEELGAGGYGVVVRAMRMEDMREVAIKIVWRCKMPNDSWVAVTGWEDKLLSTPVVVSREAHILRQICHPGVISYIDYFEDHTFVYLVMEHFGSPWSLEVPSLAEGQSKDVSDLSKASNDSLPSTSHPMVSRPGPPIRRASCDLFECLEAHERLPETTSRYVFKQLADAVCHLHRNGIVHCDLKDENIVIDANFRVKIIDFGSAQVLDPLKSAPFHQKFRGTITFAAPEILRGQAFRAPQAEVWALGCILSILLTGKGPFKSAEAARKAQISEPAVPIPSLAFDLMMGCLRLRPHDRLNICQIRDHPWLSEDREFC